MSDHTPSVHDATNRGADGARRTAPQVSRRRLLGGGLAAAAVGTVGSLTTATEARAGELLARAKASSVQEAFTERPSSAYWGTDHGSPLDFPGDGRMHMSPGSVLWTKDTYEFTGDTISTEVVDASTAMWGLVGGPGWAGGYYFTITGGQLWCNAVGSGGGTDPGFTHVRHDPAAHRFLFLGHADGRIVYQVAASFDGPRTTLRRALPTDLGTSDLRMQYANRSTGAPAVFDNLNGLFPNPDPNARPHADIDFGAVAARIAPDHLGFGCTGMGHIADRNSRQARAERTLDARRVRLMVKWDGRRTVHAGGGAWPWPSKPLVDLYRSWGYTLVVVIAGRTGDVAGYQAGDAANIVRELGTEAIEYAGPNEVDQHATGYDELVARNTQIHQELRSVSDRARVWGPSISHYGRAELFDQYLLKMPPEAVLGCDYHSYPMWKPALPTDVVYQSTPGLGDEVARTLADLEANGLPPRVMVSELNLTAVPEDGLPVEQGGFVSPVTGGLVDGRLFSAVETVWMASAIGHILQAGGMVLPYANQGGALGIFALNEGTGRTADVPGLGVQPDSAPMPAYWAIAMFTGAGHPDNSTEAAPARLFPHFLDTVHRVRMGGATTSAEVFALNNEAGGHNVVIVNKGQQAVDLVVNLSGVGPGTHDVWSTTASQPVAAPVRRQHAVAHQDSLEVRVEPQTVTTVVLAGN